MSTIDFGKKKFTFSESLKDNKPILVGNKESELWISLKEAWADYHLNRQYPELADDTFDAISRIRSLQSELDQKVTPLEEFGITQDDMNDWIISNPKRTLAMLRDQLYNSQSSEIQVASTRIRAKYQTMIQHWKVKNNIKS